MDYDAAGPGRTSWTAVKYLLIAYGLSALLFLILLKVIPWAST